jgi:hypothetical protein
MSEKMVGTMEKVVEYCKLTKEDINEVMQPVAEDLVRRLEQRQAADFK